MDDLEIKGKKLSKHHHSPKALVEMVETNDDGYQLWTNIDTVPYAENTLALKEKCMRQIGTFISEKEMSISEKSDTQFTKKWQAQLEEILLQKGDPRKIHYIVDSEGESGKTEFIAKMKARHPTRVLEVAHGNAQSMAKSMDKVKDVMKKDIILLDIPKAYKFKPEHYAVVIRDKQDEDPNTMWRLHRKTITSTPL